MRRGDAGWRREAAAFVLRWTLLVMLGLAGLIGRRGSLPAAFAEPNTLGPESSREREGTDGSASARDAAPWDEFGTDVDADADAGVTASPPRILAQPAPPRILAEEDIDAEDQPELYDDTRLRSMSLTFEDADWRRRLERMDPANPTDLPATLEIEDLVLEQVGARYKGNTSRQVEGPKKPYNIKTHAFVPGQDLWGFDVMNLNNASGDPSMLREAIGYRLMRDFMPVPRSAFVRLDVQGEYVGTYLMVEQINKEMLDPWFETGGLVIKADPPTGAALNGSALEYLGSSINRYKAMYEPKTEGAEDESLGFVRDLATALDAPISAGGLNDAAFGEGIREILDVEAALWYIVGSNATQNGDSYYAGHNYYLYVTPGERIVHPITWDLNYGFGIFPLGLFGGGRPGRPPQLGDLAEASPFLHEGDGNRPLIGRLLADERYRADYIAHLRAFRDLAITPERMHEIGTGYQDLIKAAVAEEPEPLFPYDQFELALFEGTGEGGFFGLSPGILSMMKDRYQYFVEHPDLQSPELQLDEQTIAPEAPSAADPVTVSARVSGADGPTRMELRYRVDGGRERIVDMLPRGDGATWDGTIPAQRKGARVSYVFRAGLPDGRAEFFPQATLTQAFDYPVGGVSVPVLPPGDLVINELMADNSASITDEAGEHEDWIELYNRGDAPIDLGDYFLSDDPEDPWAFPLPAVSLAPGEHYLVFCDGDLYQGPRHAGFGLSKKGEQASLATREAIVDLVSFEAIEENVSFGRALDGAEEWAVCLQASPEASNALCRQIAGRAYLPVLRLR